MKMAMASTRAVLAVALLMASMPWAASAAENSASTRVTPLQKVIMMMEDMVAKGKEEKHTEEVIFAETKLFCDGTREAKEKLISEETAKIEELTADMGAAKSDAEVLAEEIAALEAKIAADENELAEATAVRNKENADFKATEKDFSESIDAIGRAIQVLKTKTADVTQSLIQVRQSQLVPANAKAAIEAFLSMSISSESEAAAPEANAYEFQSGGVIDMLEKLEAKFNSQKLDLQKAEMASNADYETLSQQLTDDIKADKATVKAKTAMKAQRLEDAASAKEEKALTETAKAEDEKILEETNTECHEKSVEYEKNQVLRAEEVKVITKAIGILSSDSVTGAADTHLPAAALLQARSTALAQLKRNGPTAGQRAAIYLQQQAKRLGSEYLSVVAAHATSDPFAKVKKMIKDLIVKLMEEANSEADKKAYCDTELATNKQTRDIKTTEVDDLTNKIDELTALSAQLTEEITELSDAITELKTAQAEATKIRQDEKAENSVAIADAKEAQVAVEKATKLLKDFYAKAQASLMQSGAGMGLGEQMNAIQKAPYKGMQSEGGGILGFLEVVLSDFARLESETSSLEDKQSSEYEKFMNESTEDNAVKTTEMKHKENKRQDTDDDIRTSKKELTITQEELDSALDYYDKLKADCVTKKINYAERKQAREEEIESLQEALKMLASEELGF